MVLYKVDITTSATVISTVSFVHVCVHLYIVLVYKNEPCRLEAIKQIANDYHEVSALFQQ
jgi:hypothetical protein